MDMKTIYREYDGLVGITMLNIYSLSKQDKTIKLCRFDKKNKEHLYILRIAYLARDIYGFEIEVEGSWWDIFCLNLKNHRGFKRVKRYKIKNEDNVINVLMLLDFMRPEGKTRLGKDFSFADIYEEYYERKK